jgi:hypothetical protein
MASAIAERWSACTDELPNTRMGWRLWRVDMDDPSQDAWQTVSCVQVRMRYAHSWPGFHRLKDGAPDLQGPPLLPEPPPGLPLHQLASGIDLDGA